MCLKVSRQADSVQCDACLACANCKCAGFRTYSEAAFSNKIFLCRQCDIQRQTDIPRPSPMAKATSISAATISAFPLSPLANPTPNKDFATPNSTPISPAHSAYMTPHSPDRDLLHSQRSVPMQAYPHAPARRSDFRCIPPPQLHLPASPAPSHSSGAALHNSSQDHDYAVPPLMLMNLPPPTTNTTSASTTSFLPTTHPSLPNLDIVLGTHISTLSHIPRACRDTCCFTLSSLFNNIVNDPSVHNWSLLLIFAKSVLAVPI